MRHGLPLMNTRMATTCRGSVSSILYYAVGTLFEIRLWSTLGRNPLLHLPQCQRKLVELWETPALPSVKSHQDWPCLREPRQPPPHSKKACDRRHKHRAQADARSGLSVRTADSRATQGRHRCFPPGDRLDLLSAILQGPKDTQFPQRAVL